MDLGNTDALEDGRAFTFQLSKEAFGSSNKLAIFSSDMHALWFGGAISGFTICIYIKCQISTIQLTLSMILE